MMYHSTKYGLGAAYVNGVMIPSTDVPVGTPIVMNPTPGQNLQVTSTQYTGPVGGYSCNTAGGYSIRRPSCWLTDQCMSDSEYAAAQAACNGAVVSSANDPILLPPDTAPLSSGQLLYLNPASIGVTPSDDVLPISYTAPSTSAAQTSVANSSLGPVNNALANSSQSVSNALLSSNFDFSSIPTWGWVAAAGAAFMLMRK